MRKTAKLFRYKGSLAVRLPKEFHMQGTEVYVQEFGSCILISPKEGAWETFMEGVGEFTEDYFDAFEQDLSEEV